MQFMETPHVLIVEDEEDIASILEINLVSDGFKVSVLHDGASVVEWVSTHQPDIILLDVMIPYKDGFQVCKEIKDSEQTRHIPIIFLTAKTLEHNVIKGLDLGADDYIAKPFSISVVITRIRAVLRRTLPVPASSSTDGLSGKIIRAGGIVLDEAKMVVRTDAGPIDMGATEFALLAFLMRKPGWVFKRSQLMDACKGDDAFVTDRSIDVLMVAIRKKLGAKAHLIQTVRGVGYKFKEIDD